MKTTPLPELTPVLKQLRLSGILDSLDSRNREAINNNMTFTQRNYCTKPGECSPNQS